MKAAQETGLVAMISVFMVDPLLTMVLKGHKEEHATDYIVLVFTAYDADERVLGAVRAGARGYLLKGATTLEIARAIRAVAAGESALDPRVAS